MDAETRKKIEAIAVDYCKSRRPLDWTIEETKAFAGGAETMDFIAREREAKLVAALDQALRQWEMYVTEAAQDDLEKIEHAEAGELRSCKRVLAEHRAAKGEG